MSKSLKASGLKLAALTLGVAFAAQSMAATDLTVVSFGGANKNAQVKAFYGPYEKSTGNKIVAGEYNGEMAKVKAMVDTNSVSWDLVEVESPELARGCDEGLFETIDPAILGKAEDYVPGAVSNCGVGFFVWSTVLAYNADKLKTAPTSWADFWDTSKFPGKRGLRKGAKYTLEFALMADGVAPKDVYKVLATKEGQDRAFKKLDQIKPNIQWWEAGAQPPQYLASGDVVMSSAYNGRIAAVQKESNLKIVWNGGIYDFDAWAIPKGAKKVDESLKFIAFSVQPEQQKTYSENIAYGPVNKNAVPLLSKELLKDMPTTPENMQGQVGMDVTFWADYGEQLEQRFNAWAAK
ncbi:ABC transporter substrate-binding protein [Pseudomonas sp. BGr12]|uniref:ABC transporter substrate-binding protein n=1 Tax=Pseudomonas TaxID=286 RepID=UPI0009DB0898|nr:MULTISPECIES: ABC transporter substrate-binding protein [Pseudomonas]MDF3866085.1 ABC transporter substrate-binding protein [Pseudomonas denitrificans (nom. rej.)]OQR27517.1 spermidine/putrescine ABC transporter substrate-binding protein [Pseudomonas sp. T]MBD9501979.1 ABC transporter substrate-binding protein [Pseudomonas sp. PDM17]MBD9514409.1 ABC transporter substrate-binding protein [Pseudomonas sp. PDM22]MBD9579556.1 ABC transporter substrate-binding protein [Pseudomonas sp. PDM23]